MLILFAHGSPRKEWYRSLEELLASLRETAGAEAVGLACMDHGPPTLDEELTRAVDSGAERVRILPLFMTGAGHVTADIVPMVEEARARFKGLEIELLPAVGEQPLFRQLLLDLVREAGSDHSE